MPDVAMQDEQEALILESIDRFLERDVKPHVMELEHNDVYPEEIVEKMKELGLFGAIIDEEYGGLGLSCLTYAQIVERVAVVWMSLRSEEHTSELPSLMRLSFYVFFLTQTTTTPLTY